MHRPVLEIQCLDSSLEKKIAQIIRFDYLLCSWRPNSTYQLSCTAMLRFDEVGYFSDLSIRCSLLSELISRITQT